MVSGVIITKQLSFKWSIATVSFTAEKFMKVLLIRFYYKSHNQGLYAHACARLFTL